MQWQLNTKNIRKNLSLYTSLFYILSQENNKKWLKLLEIIWLYFLMVKLIIILQN